MPSQEDPAIQDALDAAPDGSYARLGEAFLAKERRIKQEICVIALLWLVGCPIVCSLTEGSDYGKPDDGFCGLPSYSISSSMTGLYPKVLGSIMASLFAVLVVQRTSCGLCSNLKLGWIVRFSPLVATEKKQKEHDENTRLMATKLWNDIVWIECLGYFAGGCLIVLVTFDAKNFLLTHLIVSQLAFFCLFRQNHLVGKLGDDDYKDLFPNWSYEYGYRIFRWGMAHFGIMWFIFLFFGTLANRGGCDYLLKLGNPSTVKPLLSVMLWSHEYAFCFLCIYTQLLQHYEFRLWEFAGATKMPYMACVSRYSTFAAAENLIYGSSDAKVLLGTGEKAKTS